MMGGCPKGLVHISTHSLMKSDHLMFSGSNKTGVNLGVPDGLFGKLRMLSALTTLFVLQEVSMLLNNTLALRVHCTWSRCPMISPSPKQAPGGPTGPGQTAWFCSSFGLRSLLLREVHGMCWRIRRNVPLTMQVRIPVAKSLKRLRRSQKPPGCFNQAWGNLFGEKQRKTLFVLEKDF